MSDVQAACAIADELPRAYPAVVRGILKYRVGSLVFIAFSADGSLMGFAFPKEMRDALVAGDPDTFVAPEPRDERFNWVRVRLAVISTDELRELVIDAWRMCVPKKVAREVDQRRAVTGIENPRRDDA